MSFEVWQQKQFGIEDERFQLSKEDALVFNRQGFKRILTQRDLWLNRPNGKGLQVELRTDQPKALLFDTRKWQKLEEVSWGDVGDLRQLSSLVVVTNRVSLGQSQGFEGVLQAAMLGLCKHNSPVFVLESKQMRPIGEKNWRQEILKNMGLVYPNILTGVDEERYLWEARKPKKVERKPVNLIIGAKEKGNYLHKIAVEVREFYGSRGLKVVSWDRIYNQLETSVFPPQDIEALKQGWGVNLQAICGCVVELGLKGDVIAHHGCGDSGCEFDLKGCLQSKAEAKTVPHQFETYREYQKRMKPVYEKMAELLGKAIGK
ncbi:MAG: hypothetical protein U9Q63_04400 [Patescibacteria group bacterium]|nr:hypothetical protein [Patescibacteria group bacterium]